jgi:hypothetical protein
VKTNRSNQGAPQLTIWRLRSHLVAALLVISGLVAILISNVFTARVLKVDLDHVLGEVGALILIVGLLHWFFDNLVRKYFFNDVRETIIGSQSVSASGISEFYSNSKDVDFSEYFLSSAKLVIGVNYSPKLIDNCIDLLERRTRTGQPTTIMVISKDSAAEHFLAHDYKIKDTIKGDLEKIENIVRQLNREHNHIKIVRLDTILRYAFIRFDSRIWVIPGTNGKGRREVPGFYVRHGTPWFDHFSHDIDLLASPNEITK